VHILVRRIAHDQGLRQALASNDVAALRSFVRLRFGSVWYHLHASRLRIVRGSRILVDIGVPFVVAPATAVLRDNSGRALGTLEVSIQDVIGFVRFLHRNYHVDVVTRGIGNAHVRSSLPAALKVRLPRRGIQVIAGKRYRVRSFTRKALNNERVRVWILMRG